MSQTAARIAVFASLALAAGVAAAFELASPDPKPGATFTAKYGRRGK